MEINYNKGFLKMKNHKHTLFSDLCNYDEFSEEASETEDQEENFSATGSAQHHGEQVHH